MNYIYGLIDPRNGQCCYVGCTSDVESRLQSHLIHPCNAGFREWIAELLDSGLKPSTHVFAKARNRADAEALEAEWIKVMGLLNPSILNVHHNPILAAERDKRIKLPMKIDEGLFKDIRIEAAYAGESPYDLIRRILAEQINTMRADRLTWEARQVELRTWDSDALESRSDYLFTQYEERSLSPDDDRELQFINRLLNERAEAEDAKAIAA